MKIIEFHEIITEIMQILEFQMRIMKIMKIIEFHWRIMTIMKIQKLDAGINKNNENLRIPLENQTNHDFIIELNVRITKIIKILELHWRIKKIIKIIK